MDGSNFQKKFNAKYKVVNSGNKNTLELGAFLDRQLCKKLSDM